jgi:putative SOS response-associated peptidase YedK
MMDVHDRMPVIIPVDQLPVWLDVAGKGASGIEAFLAPLPSDAITMYPVSTAVNSPKNDSPECLVPVGDAC